jgi:hypothetical protein
VLQSSPTLLQVFRQDRGNLTGAGKLTLERAPRTAGEGAQFRVTRRKTRKEIASTLG